MRTLLAWAGDDPARAGLVDTPARVASAFEDYFSGYGADAAAALTGAFEEPTGYDDMVLLKDIKFTSHCEHHIAPFTGRAHIAYIPDGRVVGLSRIARIVDIFSRRLQTQEALTSQIANALMSGLACKGVAVMLNAEHTCVSMRGARHDGVATITMRLLGAFETDAAWRDRFLALVARQDQDTTANGQPCR